MQFLPEILLLCLITFLYCLFVFAKEDFILLRKNVTLEQLFNMTFIGFIFILFFARVTYIIEHFNQKYLDLLVFSLFPYFPGLSFAGGIVGGFFYIEYYCKKKNFPWGRIFDIVSLSFLFSSSIGLLLFFVINIFFIKTKLLFLLGTCILFIFIFVLLSIIFFKSYLKDGSVGYLSCSFSTICLFSLDIISRNKKAISIFTQEDILFAISFIIFLFLFFLNETRKIEYRRIRKT